ncbi:electron transfer flavoprotein-ubiquinone oxidoreductase [Chitinibacteraceae bacterium HSL-7]
MQRDVMEYDLLIVGAGPSGLAAAIRAKQQAQAAGQDISVCVLEKGAEVGAHILSGAVIDTRALDELLPDWRERGAPIKTAVTDDRFTVLDEDMAYPLPNFALPPMLRNHGTYIVSLGEVCRWLGTEAEALGVEIYPGFAAADVIFGDNGEVAGVITGDMGRDRDGKETAQFALGMEIRAGYTLFAEGARGSLTRKLEEKLGLRAASGPQKYGIGIKEVWRVAKDKHQPGFVQHTLGWPLASDVGGGSFVYHYGDGLVSVGFVVHLDYANPHLSPFNEFQRFKTHPTIRDLFRGGERLSYGARVITEGGIQAWPEMAFAGGVLIGCSAGMVNVPRIKGSHNAMKSGMLAAESAVHALVAGRRNDVLADYPSALRQSWAGQELDAVRNIKPMLSRFGTYLGMACAGAEMWLSALGVRLPWTFKHKKSDAASLKPAALMPKISYPKPDNVVSFDRLSSVALSNLAHDANQPVHLTLKDAAVPITVNLAQYDAPEQRYCPAGVYEIVEAAGAPKLQINAQNCVHCKTCDIKDPTQNIVWVTPEGGSGPVYTAM